MAFRDSLFNFLPVVLDVVESLSQDLGIIPKTADAQVAAAAKQCSDPACKVVMIDGQTFDTAGEYNGFRLLADGAEAVLSGPQGLVIIRRESEILEVMFAAAVEHSCSTFCGRSICRVEYPAAGTASKLQAVFSPSLTCVPAEFGYWFVFQAITAKFRNSIRERPSVFAVVGDERFRLAKLPSVSRPRHWGDLGFLTAPALAVA